MLWLARLRGGLTLLRRSGRPIIAIFRSEIHVADRLAVLRNLQKEKETSTDDILGCWSEKKLSARLSLPVRAKRQRYSRTKAVKATKAGVEHKGRAREIGAVMAKSLDWGSSWRSQIGVISLEMRSRF